MGDIAKHNFGIEKEQLTFLKKNLSGMVHAAANVTLNQPLNTARENALTGTKTAVNFAQSCDHLHHFHYISTVGVNGKSKSILVEDKPPINTAYHNTYEQAKAEAELFVIEKMEQGFPCTVYRPGMIVGDSKTGAIYAKQVFYYICDFIIRGGVARVMPSLSHFHLDTIPVDYLADFIANCIEHSDETVGKIYNVCAGHEHAVSMQQLTQYIKESLRRHNRDIPFNVTVPIPLFNQFLTVLSIVSSHRLRQQIKSLSHLMSYLKHSPKFSNQQYVKDAQRFGLSNVLPSEYLNTILDTYMTNYVVMS